MTPSENPTDPSVPSDVYTREYFTNCCQGYEEFTDTLGARLPLRLSIPLELANIKAGDFVLDVGSGRGEIVRHATRLGAAALGLDYAREAVSIARDALHDLSETSEARYLVMRSNARHLPVADDSVDVVFMLDVVEHLYPHELAEAFTDILRVLRSGGRLVIHTMPNLWYYRWGYPVYRSLQRLRGQRLPSDPRARWDFSHVHVNEQTPASLRRALSDAGFYSKVWLKSTQSYTYEKNRLVQFGMNFLTSAVLLRNIFCNDIFAIGTKP